MTATSWKDWALTSADREANLEFWSRPSRDSKINSQWLNKDSVDEELSWPLTWRISIPKSPLCNLSIHTFITITFSEKIESLERFVPRAIINNRRAGTFDFQLEKWWHRRCVIRVDGTFDWKTLQDTQFWCWVRCRVLNEEILGRNCFENEFLGSIEGDVNGMSKNWHLGFKVSFNFYECSIFKW